MTTTDPAAEASQAGTPKPYRNLLTGLLLMLAAWAIYLPSLRYDYVYYDDVRILKVHPELYGQEKFSDDLRAIFVTEFPREEPLPVRDVSWAVDSQIFGFNSTLGHHLGNVLVHGVVVALMFAFLLGTTRRYGFALAVTIGWLVLAIHVEPVAWIMGRKDVLSALFILLALCAQTRRLESASLRAHAGWYLVTLACFIGSLLSKISALTFPVVLFLHAVFLPYLNGSRPAAGPFPWGKSLIKEILLMIPGLAVSVPVFHWYKQMLTQMGVLDRGPVAHGLAHIWNLLIVDPPTLWMYAQQLFFPWRLRLFYSWPQVMDVYPHWLVAASLAFMALLAGAGLWLFCRRKDLFFYYAAFFVIMLPYLNQVLPGLLVAERYLYLAAFCVLALVVTAGMAILRRAQPVWRSCTLAAAGVFLAVNLYQTFSYQPAWRDGETLWQYHLNLPQPQVSAYANLAAYYYAQASDEVGKPEMAAAMGKMSVVVDAGLAQFWPDQQQPPPPDTYFLFFLKSIVQEVRGEPEAALGSLLTADRLRPKFDSTQLNLALLYHKLAEAAADPKQKETYACAARDRYEEYIALEYRGRPAPADVQKTLAEFVADCPAKDPAAGKN
ncbi:MAG TPA: hypothetical protein VG347_12835 [Verrucomicrobiae bacterium]|nr:hypothetical protein [Verrucomicrobiae bacterium]